MRILLTNNTLAARGGTDLYIRDVAIELMRRGHKPVVYSTHLGDVAHEIRSATVPVIDTLQLLSEKPDVIHAQHQYDTLTAMMRFPETPVVSFCHGWLPWEEAPLRFPQIMSYVAVSEVCRERLVSEGGIASDQIELIPNFFDQELFPPRAPLPEQPRLALSFSNTMTPDAGLSVLQRACERRVIKFHSRGRAQGGSERHPGKLLANYDVVFARGRSAIEAMAVGAAVVLCDEGRLGPMVTRENFAGLTHLNFALRALLNPLTEQAVVDELLRYNTSEAAAVSALAREKCEMVPAVDRIVEVYIRAIEKFRARPAASCLERTRALVCFLEEAAPHYKHSILEEERRTWRTSEERHQRVLAEECRKREQAEQQFETQRTQLEAAAAEMAAMRRSASWRWSQAVLRNPLINAVFGRVIRSLAERHSAVA